MISPDQLLDREKLLELVRRYRMISIILPILIISGFLINKDSFDDKSPHILRINIEGEIFQDNEREKKIRSLVENKGVKAVIVKINSPGGTIYGSQQLYDAFKFISKSVSVVSVIETLGASGGYMAAIAGEKIFAKESSLLGSVGVIMQSYELTELAKKIGVNPVIIKSAPFKAIPGEFEKLNQEQRESLMKTLNSGFEFFVNLVNVNRKLAKNHLEIVKKGGVFTGLESIELGLIDFLGGEEEALDWLKSEKKLHSKIKVIDYEVQEKENLASRYISKVINKVFNKLNLGIYS